MTDKAAFQRAETGPDRKTKGRGLWGLLLVAAELHVVAIGAVEQEDGLAGGGVID